MVVRYRETEIPTPDRQRLFVRTYESRIVPAGRTLLIAHGASEHGERYRHIAEFFVAEGWNVIVGDHRGHGRSSGVRTHVKRFRQYPEDLELIRGHFELSPQSTAILGHSMGGLIAIRHAQMFPERAAALVLVSPLLKVKVPIPRRTLALGRMLSLVAPQVRFETRVDPRTTTRCPNALERRLNDALMHRSVTARWYFAVRAGLQSAWRTAATLKTPLLVLQAGADEIVDPKAPELWLKRVGSADASLRTFPEHLHELLNEPDWPSTAAIISEWLDQRINSSQKTVGTNQLAEC